MMQKLLLGVAFAALSALANVSMAAVDLVPVTTVTHLGRATTTFSCGQGSSGGCNYLILVSLCKESLLADGTKERRCTYSQAAPSFQLKAGETKTISNLPADFLYTMKVGRMPTFEECVNSPMPH